MGMDVYGKAAKSETGKYFRNNAWWWRPLARYCAEIAPEVTSACTYWQSNDGDGLDAEASAKLADALQAEIDAGRTMLHEKRYNGSLELMQDEPCKHCHGTGRRTDMVVANGCNACYGKGSVRPSATFYPFSVENVEGFIAFLRDCGGFEIN